MRSETGRLIVQWHRQTDRFCHDVAWSDGAETIRILTSPDSCRSGSDAPPIQELERPTDKLALGIGMAGRNYWSTSVALSSDHKVEFDVACRLNESVPRIGMVYSIDEEVATWRTVGDHLEANVRNATIVLESLVTSDTNPTFCNGNQHRWMLGDGNLALRIPASELDLPATVRWKYRLVVRDVTAA